MTDVYESPFPPALRLPLQPTFNSSNPFLNSTDNVTTSGLLSGGGRLSDLGAFSADDIPSGSSQPHPLKRSRGTKRNIEDLGDVERLDTDDLPDRTLDEDFESLPPPRKSAQRLIDLSACLEDYAQPQPLPAEGIEDDTNEEVKDEAAEEEQGEYAVLEEAYTDQDAAGEGEYEEEQQEDEGDTEGSELSSDFDAAQFQHDCDTAAAVMKGDKEEEVPRDSAFAPGILLRMVPSSDLYDEHMQVRLFDDRLDVKADIRKINEGIAGLQDSYRIVDRLGEGTFSSVYKAIDLYAYTFKNQFWRNTIHVKHSSNIDTYIPDLREESKGSATDLNIEDKAWEDDGRPKKNYVALKRIYVTSSPDRIMNELEIMEELRGCRNTAQLITAFRSEDQVVAVMPYHRSDDFRLFYKYIDPPNIRKYFRCLFRALNDSHRRGIVHRDVKPANFLWDFKTGEGVLVDFGLAERYEPPTVQKWVCQHCPATLDKPHGEREMRSTTHRVEQAVYQARNNVANKKVGVPQVDNRPGVRANRAGTRGFRAPEVLLKCPDQTVAIDIWAAGIILLSILCHRFPIFNSNDDTEALLELAAVWGKNGIEKVAMLHNRTFCTNLHTVPATPPKSLPELVLTLNPNLYTPPCVQPTPAEAKRHIESVDSMLDMLKRCLAIDATRRWTAGMLLKHKFLEEGLRDDEKEPPSESVRPHDIGKGACGHLHYMKNAQHYAVVNGSEFLCGWGQGRAYGTKACYLHDEENLRPTFWDDDVEMPH